MIVKEGFKLITHTKCILRIFINKQSNIYKAKDKSIRMRRL